MRIAIPMRRAVLFAILFAVALILFFPLRLAVGGSGLSAREASGSVWSGSLKEARIGPAVLGDLDARLSPLALLTGRMRLDVARPSAAPDRLIGAFSLSRKNGSIESFTGLVPVEPTSQLQPITSVDLTDVTIRFRDGACDRAEGLVSANLSSEVMGTDLPAAVSGSPRCDAGSALFPLASPSGRERIELRLGGPKDGQGRVVVGGKVLAEWSQVSF